MSSSPSSPFIHELLLFKSGILLFFLCVCVCVLSMVPITNEQQLSTSYSPRIMTLFLKFQKVSEPMRFYLSTHNFCFFLFCLCKKGFGLGFELGRVGLERVHGPFHLLAAGIVQKFMKIQDPNGRSRFWLEEPICNIFKNLNSFFQKFLKCILICN